MLLNTPPMTCVHLLEAITVTSMQFVRTHAWFYLWFISRPVICCACTVITTYCFEFVCMCVCVCVNIRVLETLDQVAGAILVMENETLVQENVVMEVVARSQTTLQQNGLTTTQLGGGNMVELPAALFSLPSIPATLRISAVSINNRNLVPPRTRNNLLRGNIISVNLNVPGGLSNLGNDQRIRLTFQRVCIMQH